MSDSAKSSRERVPELAAIPKYARRFLVDEGMVHYEASVAGFAERYRRGETPHTVQVWWARRPHSAMRALAFSCMCDDLSEDAMSLMGELSQGQSPLPLILHEARNKIQKDGNKPQRVLDMFGGSGTIAFEAARLGADVSSIDTNELAVFVQKGTLSFCQGIPDLPAKVKAAGKRVLKQLEKESSPIFPLRGSVFGYLWSYSTKCSECSYEFLLSKRPWLSKKAGRRTALRQKSVDGREVAEIVEADNGDEFHSAWTGRNGTIECPKCHHHRKQVVIDDCKDEIVAMVGNATGSGKNFSPPDADALPSSLKMEKIEKEILKSLGKVLPESELPPWSGIVNPAIYGIRTHAEFLGRRQRLVLLLLIKCLSQEYDRLRSSDGEKVAKGVIAMLSGMVDQLVDWNCRLSMWISQNEQVGRAFCGPGIPMLWDYVETDPVQSGPANLWKKLDRIVAGCTAITEIKSPVDVRLSPAQELPYEDGTFDAIITDPPYYDNIYYNVLSDFFFAWKKLLLADIEPELFGRLQTSSERELVASTIRSGGAQAAHDGYIAELGKALSEAERVLKKDGVFSLLYSHASFGGWEALARAYRSTGLFITSVQPLSIERKQRPRAMTSEAVNTCIVFVARRINRAKRLRSLKSMSDELRTTTESLYQNLSEAGWHDEDIGVAAYAQGVGMLANASGITGDVTDIHALEAFHEIVRAVIPSFRVTKRRSL